MSADKEIVLKNFGFASETHFMFYYVLQLFLSLEEDRTHDPYSIEAGNVYSLCESPGRLPTHIRHFIMWECNIIQRDSEEIMNIEMPRGLTQKYDVKASYLAQLEDKVMREKAIQSCIDEINGYFGQLNEVRAVLEATNDRFKTVEDHLVSAESMDGGLARILSEQKRVIEDLRIQLTAFNADLEDDVMPDVIKFEEIPERALNLMITLSETNLKIRDAIRRYSLGQDMF